MQRAVEMLRMVRIPEPERRVAQYPHELSGGMRQRVMIAMALACEPRLLIADEPTTALDVTIQAQILDLMRELKERTGAAIVLITHDLGVVAEMAQRVVVMYAGRKVEEAPVATVRASRAIPYTRGPARFHSEARAASTAADGAAESPARCPRSPSRSSAAPLRRLRYARPAARTNIPLEEKAPGIAPPAGSRSECRGGAWMPANAAGGRRASPPLLEVTR
jgi:peptide/nickel transport system ATP-binding protein